MARWRKSGRDSPNSRETPISKRSSSAPPARPGKPHDRRADLCPVAVDQEPAADAAAAIEKAEVSGRRGGGRRLFLLFFLSQFVCGTTPRDGGARGPLAGICVAL